MGQNYCICGCDSKFKSGIQSALQELDMMMPPSSFDRNKLDTIPEWAPVPEKTLAQKGWEYAQMLSDREDQDLFGLLTDGSPGSGYKFKVEVWKNEWNSCPPDEEPTELKVTRTMSWMLSDWNNDENGGPGLIITSVFETPSGKPYQFNVVIPKDELIKALATLVRD